MQLKTCSIDIKADPFTATTFIEMEFYNPNDQEIEGMQRFELKPGQVITAFQLDLNGKYRDGSIDEKWKATNAYNSIVGKRVDPALLTMEYADHYRLNIYPVPARGSRKITMTIKQLLRQEQYYLVYWLPLNFLDTVKQFRLDITVNSDALPITNTGLINGKSFAGVNQQHGLHWYAENITARSPVIFSIPVFPNKIFCTKTVDQKTYFALRFKPSYPAEYDVHPKLLTVFWDASASAAKKDISREINFLKQFISFHKVEQLTIIPFNHKLLDTVVYSAENNFNGQWQQYLQNISYDGATQLGVIDLAGFDADMFLLFTDGNNTYGKNKPVRGTTLVSCVYTGNAANIEALQQIVGASGGKVIDLRKTSMSDAVAINSKAQNWLLNISSASGKTITEQSLPLKIDQPLLVNGVMNTISDTLYFQYGNNNSVLGVEKIVIGTDKQCPSSGIERVSMLNNFARITRSYLWEDILDFGLQEKVVTPNTAYIVLEKAEDYIKYNISPPADLQEACERLNYVKKDTRRQRRILKESDEFTIINDVVNTYNDRIRKWDKKENLISLNRADFDKEKQIQNTGQDVTSTPTIRPGMEANNGTPGSSTGISERGEMEEVVVVGYASAMRKNLTGSVSYVRSQDLQQSSGTVEQALQGRVAGLQVTSNGTEFTNNQFNIHIRGTSSLTGNNEPLYVLDGIPVSGNINNYISVNEIESISVFKDIQASALYGSRAANGAIVITSKKGRIYYRNSNKPYRLVDMEDIEYLQEIKQTRYAEKKTVYLQLKQEHEDDPGFYFDMAQHFFEKGLKDDAMEILMNAAEVSNGSNQVLRAIGYTLESWKQFEQAALVYKQLLDDSPGNLYSYRDLAWAYYQDGKYQQAIDILYEAIKNDSHYSEWWNLSLKAMILSELNAMIAVKKDKLDISAIPSALIRPIPVDLRIVLDCNKGNLGSVSIKEPGGLTCSYVKPITKNGGVLATGQYGYYYGGPAEYQVKNAPTGKYKVSLNYYDYYSYPGKIPAFVRMVAFRNFGKTNQSIDVQNVIMDNQYGEIEIGEIKW